MTTIVNYRGQSVSIFKYSYRFVGILLLILTVSISASAQKNKNRDDSEPKGGNGTKDLIVRACVETIGNGLMNVQFGYDNPNNKDMVVAEDGSFIINSKNKKSKAVNFFKKGSVDNAFTRQINERERVEWNVIQPNGKTKVVIADANSSKCPVSDDDGIFFPVYGNERGVVTDQALTALGSGNGGETPSPLVYSIRPGQVLVEIVHQEGQLQNALNLLQTTFGFTYDPDPEISDFIVDPAQIIADNLPTIEGWCDISQVLQLNQFPEQFKFIRTLYPAKLLGGVVTSQGVSSLGVDEVRESFRILNSDGDVVPVDGDEIITCTISDSFNNSGFDFASVDIANGDLSGAANPDGYLQEIIVLKEASLQGTIDEGRAMMQLIHDVSPGVTQMFHTGLTPGVFNIALEACIDNGAHVINDDLTHITSQMFGVDLSTEIIQNWTNNIGKVYVSSAGNASDDAYQATFQPSQQPFLNNFLAPGSPAVAHVFGINPDGSEDVTQQIQVDRAGVYQIAFQWGIVSNGFETYPSQGDANGAIVDLDFLIVDDLGNVLVDNTDQNIDRDPSEVITFQSRGAGTANIMIIAPEGVVPNDLVMRYIIFETNGLEVTEYFSGAPTITGKVMDPSVQAVAAYDYNTDNIEQFSSFGGNRIDNFNIQPAFAFPNRTEVNVQGFGVDLDGNGFQEFFGTSAAAPHAAASIALFLSTRQSWGEIPGNVADITNPAADKIIELLKSTSSSMGDPSQAGAGRANVLEAFKSLAIQTPVLTQLIIEEGELSAEPTVVTILGKFLPDTPIVNFDGQPVEILEVTKNELNEVTQIKVLIPEFVSNPPLTVSPSEGKTETGEDKQPSDPLFFFDDGVAVLSVTPDSVEIVYGQTPAPFTFKVNGLPEGVDFTSLGLPAIVFNTPATFPYPNVNNYLLTASFAEPLTPEQEALFKVNFKPSLFQVKRRDMTLSYEDITAEYGEVFTPVLKFTYDQTGISDVEDFENFLANAYQSTFFPDNTLIVLNRFRTVVNGFDLNELLENGSWVSSDRVITNRFRTVVNGLNILDLDIEHFEDYTDALSDVSTNRFRTVINRFRTVVNGFDLIYGNLDVTIENRFRTVVNSTGIGGDGDDNTYENVFAVIDEEDIPTDAEPNEVEQLFSLNLVTGLGAGTNKLYPGAWLSPEGRFNLNVTTRPAVLNITPATLFVSLGDILVEPGLGIDSAAIPYDITGYVYGEDESIFTDGVKFRFLDADGNEYQEGDAGVYRIVIDPPNDNYVLDIIEDGFAFFNADYDRKIRTYTDCVEAVTAPSDGFDLIANFRYINPNDMPIYILEGEENFIEGEYEGDLPEVFMPGENVFQIRFRSSETIKWTLISGGSANSSAATSFASLNSNRCGKSLFGNDVISIYPNPVETILAVEKNTDNPVEVYLFDSYGFIQEQASITGESGSVLEMDMSGYANGIYIIRCVIDGNGYTYQIKKE